MDEKPRRDIVINEDQLEQQATQWFQDIGWSYTHGPDISPEGVAEERTDFREVVLKGRLAEAVANLNPDLPETAVEEVVQIVTKTEAPVLVQGNRGFHRLLLNGAGGLY